MYGYIYKFTLLETGDFYVGKHKYSYECLDESYWGSGVKWTALIRQYDKSTWPEIIEREILDWADTEAELNQKEIFWINETNARSLGLNIAIGGNNPIMYGKDNPSFGTHLSKEAKARISAASKAWHAQHPGLGYSKLKQWQLNNPEAYSKAQVRHLTGTKNGMYGKGYLLKGKKFSDIHKKHLSENHADTSGSNNPFYGKHHTPETILKLRAASGKEVYIYDIEHKFIISFTNIKEAANWLLIDRRIIDSRYDTNKVYFSKKLNRPIIFCSKVIKEA